MFFIKMVNALGASSHYAVSKHSGETSKNKLRAANILMSLK